jgi:glycosyltransferase involved in cell wall biosynthesis
MDKLKLTVAILTYKRPEELRLGLPVVIEHVRNLNDNGEHAISGEVLVVDNDPAGSAQSIVSQLGSDVLRYVIEPQAGISSARNRALDEAKNSDLLSYIDDDERPQEQWLIPLIETWKQSGAAAVMGRVVSTFETDPDPWIQAGRFFVRRRMKTGTAVPVAAAGNLLLDMHQVRKLGVQFHPDFGLTGAEDTLFSRMLTERGGVIVWCDESVATDFVPRTRSTKKWVLARSWSHGNSATMVELYLAQGMWAKLLVRTAAILRGFLRVFGGGGRYVVGLILQSNRHEARGLRAALRGLGMVAGAFGVTYQEYARTPKGGNLKALISSLRQRT